MKKPDIDQLIKDVQNKDSIAIKIVKTALNQYYDDIKINNNNNLIIEIKNILVKLKEDIWSSMADSTLYNQRIHAVYTRLNKVIELILEKYESE